MPDIIMQPIGYVKNAVQKRKDVSWGEDISTVVLMEEYYGGLAGLADFSHVIIIYYLDKAKHERENKQFNINHNSTYYIERLFLGIKYE